MNADTAGPTSRTYYSQRLRLHYVDWGNRDAPPLLLVHGGRDHCRNWDWVARRLRKDWHVIAPDLRGHGDSEWSKSANYSMAAYIYDLAQLVHQQKLSPVTIIGHSLGGAITVRYAGIYPENVKRFVSIEGLGRSPKAQAEHDGKSMVDKMRDWVENQRHAAGRQPRRYASIEDALARMQEQNKHLSAEQARHLTLHGVNQNEDGTFTWKFDHFVRVWLPYDMAQSDIEAIWHNISSPSLMIYGKESWASDPRKDGRARHFKDAAFVQIVGAGHWVHHDQLETFMSLVDPFIKGQPVPSGLAGVS